MRDDLLVLQLVPIPRREEADIYGWNNRRCICFTPEGWGREVLETRELVREWQRANNVLKDKIADQSKEIFELNLLLVDVDDEEDITMVMHVGKPTFRNLGKQGRAKLKKRNENQNLDSGATITERTPTPPTAARRRALAASGEIDDSSMHHAEQQYDGTHAADQRGAGSTEM